MIKTKKRVAVVMGGGADLGKSICIALSNSGIQVVVSDIDDARAIQCADLLSNIGSKPF